MDEFYSNLGGDLEQMAVLMGSDNMRGDVDYVDPWLDYNISFDGIGEYDDLADAEFFNEDDGFHYARGRRRRLTRRKGGGLRLPSLRGRSGGRRRTRRKRSRRGGRGGGFGGWLKNTFTTPEGRERRRKKRAEKSRTQRMQADTNREFAKAAQRQAEQGPDPLLAAALAPAPALPGAATPGASGDGFFAGWSTQKKVLVGVGIAAVLGLSAWAISASLKSKKPKTK